MAVTACIFTINEINAAIFKAWKKKKLYIKTDLKPWPLVTGKDENKRIRGRKKVFT